MKRSSDFLRSRFLFTQSLDRIHWSKCMSWERSEFNLSIENETMFWLCEGAELLQLHIWIEYIVPSVLNEIICSSISPSLHRIKCLCSFNFQHKETIGQREGFSKSDIEKIQNMYKCTKTTSSTGYKPTFNVTPLITSGSISDIWNMIIPTDAMQWIIRNMHNKYKINFNWKIE